MKISINKKLYDSKDIWLFENLFNFFSSSDRITKYYDQIKVLELSFNVKGDIAEFGVFKGASLIRFCSFLKEKKVKKIIYGFDTFDSFPTDNISDNETKKIIKKFTEESGNSFSKKILEKILKFKKIKNFKLIKGNIFQTFPLFLNRNKKIRFSLVHMDMDHFEPTFFILENIFSKISKKGLILFDNLDIPSEKLAIKKFVVKKNLKLIKISKKLGYVIKD